MKNKGKYLFSDRKNIHKKGDLRGQMHFDFVDQNILNEEPVKDEGAIVVTDVEFDEIIAALEKLCACC